MEKAKKNHTSTRIFTLNELSLRLSPALADEIGLNESIMLLQLEYWISISDHWIEGQRWTYQSVRQMQEKAFSFWSIATVARTVNSLLDKCLIIEGKYNKKAYDNTRWFALNCKELSKLRSVMIKGYDAEGSETPPFQIETPSLLQDETALSQNEAPPLQDETTLSQNETTIPQITPQTSPEISSQILGDDEEDGARANPTKPILPKEASNVVLGLKAIKFAETNLQRTMSKYEREKLEGWCKKFAANPDCHDPESIVIAVLQRCVVKQDLSSLVAYLDTVLEDFQRNQITNTEQIFNFIQIRKKELDTRVPRKNRQSPEINNSGPVAPDKYANFYL